MQSMQTRAWLPNNMLSAPKRDPGDSVPVLTSEHTEPTLYRPLHSRGRLLRVWLLLGVQSFGGGTALLYLMRRAVVEQHRWLTDEEYTHDWAICQISPGINILSMTVLIGWKVAGATGSLLALLGLLLPSVTITILMTALYAVLRDLEVVQQALRGVVPAVVGLGLLLAWKMARPLIILSRSRGTLSLLLSCSLLLGSAVLTALWHPPVLIVLWMSGAVHGLASWRRTRLAAVEPSE